MRRRTVKVSLRPVKGWPARRTSRECAPVPEGCRLLLVRATVAHPHSLTNRSTAQPFSTTQWIGGQTSSLTLLTVLQQDSIEVSV